MATSSSRSEWYEEYPEPDAPEVHRLVGVSIRGADLRPIGLIRDYNALTGQMSVYVMPSIHSMQESVKQITEAMKGLAKRLTPDAPPQNETVRERALRLAKQPHSMASDPSKHHFDCRGRRIN